MGDSDAKASNASAWLSLILLGGVLGSLLMAFLLLTIMMGRVGWTIRRAVFGTGTKANLTVLLLLVVGLIAYVIGLLVYQKYGQTAGWLVGFGIVNFAVTIALFIHQRSERIRETQEAAAYAKRQAMLAKAREDQISRQFR